MTLLNTIIGPVFYKLVYMSITSLAAGAVVLLFRRLTDKRFSPFWKYAMWLLVLAALVVPWRPQSRAAVLAPAEAVQAVSFRGDYNRAQAEYSEILSQAQAPQPEVEAARKEAAVLRVKTLAFDELLPLLWLCGAGAVAAFMGIASFRLRRGVRRSEIDGDTGRYEELLDRCRRRLGIKRRIRIMVQSHVSTPALLGLLRPAILLPDYAASMSDERLEYVILHELSHLRRRDHLVNALLLALRAVYWFNPLVWLLFRYVREDMELANDAAVLKGMGQEAQKGYSLSLVEVLMGCTVQKQKHAMLCMTDGKKNIERRIGMIQLGEFFKKRKWLFAIAGILVIAGIAALFLTTGVNREQRENYDFYDAGVAMLLYLPKGIAIAEPPGAPGDQYFLEQRAIHKDGHSIGRFMIDPLEDISELLRELPSDVENYREGWAIDGIEGSVTLLCNAGATRVVLGYNLTLNRYVQIEFDYDTLTDEEQVAIAKSLVLRGIQHQGETRQFQHGDLLLEITNVANVENKTQFENDVPREIAVYTLYPGAQLSVINADTYDTINTENGLPYERWNIYLASGEFIPIRDDMPSLEITPDMMSIYADGRIAGTTVLLFVMYNEAQYVPQMRPTFLSPNMGLEALKPLIYGSDGWGIDAQGDYIFAHFWRYVLRYDAKTNKIDKIIDLGEAPEYWYYAATFSPDGQSCVAQASEFDGPGRTHKMLIDLKNETAVPTEQEFFPHSIERNLNSVRLRGFGDEDSWWLGDAEDNPISGPIKALQPYATMAAQTIIIDKNRVGAILPSDAGWDALGYYKFAAIDLAQDRIVQECPMNVLKPGEVLSLYPPEPEPTSRTLAEGETRPAIKLLRDGEQDGLLLRVESGYLHKFTSEPFILTATITNTSGRDIVYGVGSGTPDMHMEIQVSIYGHNNATFIDMDTYGKEWNEEYRFATLKAGETFTQTIRFLPGVPDGDMFPAGEYEGTAVFTYFTGTTENPGEQKQLQLEFPIILF